MKEPIFILGMAHTGTTAVAMALATAPGWRIHTSGKEADRLECDELLHQDDEALRAVMATDLEAQWIFKRPWMEQSALWFLEKFPDAYYLVCMKSFVRCWDSWNKERSAAMRGLKNSTPERAWKIWCEHMRFAARLIGSTDRAAWVDHSAFCRRPSLLGDTVRGFGIEAQWDWSSVKAEAE
jgi:hypothetical protein